MPSKKPGHRRFNPMSFGRAAVLMSRGATRTQVVEHYFRKYGKKWRITDKQEMERYLFQNGAGRRFRFSSMYEGKTPEQIRSNYKSRSRQNAMYEDALRVRQHDPEFIQKNRERMIAQINTPEVRQKSREASSRSMKQRLQDPQFIKHLSERTKAHRQKPEVKKFYSELFLKLWSIPEWRTLQIALSHSTRGKWRSRLIEEFNNRKIFSEFDKRTRKNIAATKQNPEEESILNERQQRVKIALQELTPKEIKSILATFFEGKDHESAAAEMGLTIPQFNKLIEKALQKMAKHLRNV